MKQALALLAAVAFGALVVYAVMSRRPAYPEEWGVVIVHFMRGPNLAGLWASREDCLHAKALSMKTYRQVVGAIGKEDPRVLIIDDDDQLPVTFSCLPLSEIRGLHLDVGGRPSN